MRFGWINIFGAVIVMMMLIPNIIYALRNKGEQNNCTNHFMNVLEQLGRYACIILMWLPFPIGKFGFASVYEMLLYFAANGVLLAVYWIVYALYLKKKTQRRAFILAIVPTCIFLISGLLLRHWLLVFAAILFGIGHIYVARKNLEGIDIAHLGYCGVDCSACNDFKEIGIAHV